MFIDRAKIEVRSGKGGDGMIAFHREKYVDKGGPSGGNGGRGASIIFRGCSACSTLTNFRHSKVIIGEPGGKGQGKNAYGRSAKDIYVDVPVGTVIYDADNGNRFIADINEEGKEVIVAKGGRGGRGNACFKTSKNRTPRVAENGLPGVNRKLILELKLIADAGLVGFPSVGKSTLLSVVTSATPEIADYPFTTIEPNLGVVSIADDSFILADLPGLIKGAHEGKGLGLEFLRHIERCRVLIHMIDMSGARDPYVDYKTICEELKEYGFNLINRPTIIVGTKMDEEGAEARRAKLEKKIKKEVIGISCLTKEGIEKLLYTINDLLKVTKPFPMFDEEGSDATNVTYDAYQKGEGEIFDIVKEKDHQWRIIGDSITRTYSLINISTDEGLMKLISYLRRIGVETKLKEMGAKDGDTVILVDFEFEYIG